MDFEKVMNQNNLPPGTDRQAYVDSAINPITLEHFHFNQSFYPWYALFTTMEFLVYAFSNNMIQRDEKMFLNQLIGTVCFILRIFIVINCCAVIYFLVPVTYKAITICYNNQYYDFKTGEIREFYSLFCFVFCWIGWIYVVYLYTIWIP